MLTAFESNLPMHQAEPSLTSSLSERRATPPVRFLTEEESLAVFTLNAYLEEERAWEGPALHGLFTDWLRGGGCEEIDLQEWLRARDLSRPFQPSRFERAVRRGRQWLLKGISVAVFPGEVPGKVAGGISGCPRVLFCAGRFSENQCRVAVFNSRKPRLPDPRAEWLVALRHALDSITAADAELAGSLGTLTYDLATIHVRHHRSRHLLVLPSPVEDFVQGGISLPLPEAPPPDLIVTCHTGAMICSKATRAVCRDRLLAFLSDVHVMIEVRTNGNLARVLYDQQRSDPRRQAIFQPDRLGTGNAGNLQIQSAFPEWNIPFSVTRREDSSDRAAPVSPPPSPDGSTDSIPREEYLYHYTRSCPGPWPGQSYDDYLLDILAAGPLSAHTALDTLIRIMNEERIRACGQLVRGGHAAVSLTSLPPGQLESIRKWNPALIRWTFEPYGIAIRRKLLRRRGATPAIYARASCYPEIRPSERYRFQLHKPPWSSWKYEREWRLNRDIDLDALNVGDAFLFVPREEDAERLRESVDCRLPVVIVPVGESPRPPEDRN